MDSGFKVAGGRLLLLSAIHDLLFAEKRKRAVAWFLTLLKKIKIFFAFALLAFRWEKAISYHPIDEAIKMAKEAIELYIESLKMHDEEIPTEEETLEYTLTIR